MREPSQAEAKYFVNGIFQWFEKNGRNFPWRKKNLSLYESLVAEILLQQTRAEKVQEVYPKFLEKFSCREDLAGADIPQIEEMIRPLGLFRRRARGFKRLASTLIDREQNNLDSLEALTDLPYVGQYIGRSVLVTHFGEPEPMLDVNMARVLERYFGPRELADIRDDTELNDLAKQLVSEEEPKRYNWGVIDFASEVCKAQKPNCQACPISANCKFFLKRNEEKK